MTERPRVLIEEWLPITELGIESRRESAPIPGQFPKLKTLHVWWARRPLAACAGVVLGSVMPVWSKDLAAAFSKVTELQSEKAYRAWFLRLCGVLGDPIEAKRRIARADEKGLKLGAKAYGYKQAFKNSPSVKDLELLHSVLRRTWGGLPTVLDPTAGGGSIPYEALRYGLPTTANDLNPVAAAILRAGIEIPARFGLELIPDLEKWGKLLIERVGGRLERYFKKPDSSDNTSYLFARTVACPRTGKLVPLSPNWWLSKGKDGSAVRLHTERGNRELREVEFEIVSPVPKKYDPDQGTVAGGDAVSPWDNLVIEGDYIKAEAQAGRMGSQLYAVAIRVGGKRNFRAPNKIDLDALRAAEKALSGCLPGWLTSGVVPSDELPMGGKTAEPIRLGMDYWWKLFSPRQLLVHGTFVEEFDRLIREARAAMTIERADAVLGVLGMMQGKGLNWNALLTSWDTGRDKVRSVFDQHNLSVKFSWAEFEGAQELYPWCLTQLLDGYEEIARLLRPTFDGVLLSSTEVDARLNAKVMKGTGGDLRGISDGSQALVCIDPPYYDNVMYAELSDFFLAWEQHTVGKVWPDLMGGGLSDKENEAVANAARFADAGKRRKELANADYEAKMTAIFQECRRVLRDDGVLTVMFTHKRAEAWDSLGTGLMEAGFVIETSWAVNTESEQSLHQANLNAATSTIMLVCRKRLESEEKPPFFEDIESEVRQAARDALLRFSKAGISGVDLLLSTYGPALSVISSRWPVYSSEADSITGKSRLLRPEEALDAARAEVVRIQRQRLLGKPIQLDPITDFVLIAWDTFKAVEFPFDEARRLALATGGLDVDELARAKVLDKKSGTVVLLEPAKRLRRNSSAEESLPGVRPNATAFPVALDAVHTVLYVADVDGMSAAKSLIERVGLRKDARFLAALEGLMRAIPRTKIKGDWVRPEARLLDAICTAWFPDIKIPEVEAEPEIQSGLFDEGT